MKKNGKKLAQYEKMYYLCGVKIILRQEVAAHEAAIFVSILIGKRYSSNRVVDTETPTESSRMNFNSA